LPTKAGINVKDERSISMPVSINFPVASQGVKIFDIADESPLREA
jgi:hypothetical protein